MPKNLIAMRKRRLILILLVAIGVAPGNLVRSVVDPPKLTGAVSIRELPYKAVSDGPLTLAGLWQYESQNDGFGGYSALVSLGDGSFLAGSDAGRVLLLYRPDGKGPAPQVSGFTGFSRDSWVRIDLESLVRDRASGMFWAGVESSNQIVRFNADRTKDAVSKPPAMADWAINAGAESMVLLGDGRFLVVAEKSSGDARHAALVFEGDPTADAGYAKFSIIAEPGYRPADATLLPDGRVLVVLRTFELGLPPYFSVKLAVFDPADIEEDATILLEPLSDLGRPFPSENFEGAVATEEEGGDWAIWLISDDNFSLFQRTLLMRLNWPQDAR